MWALRLWILFYLTPTCKTFSSPPKQRHMPMALYQHGYRLNEKKCVARKDSVESDPIRDQGRRSALQFLSTLAFSLLPMSPTPVQASSNRFNFLSLSVMKVRNGEDMTPVNVPEVRQQEIIDGFLLGKGLEIESWMLKLLPIKSNVFQTIQQDLASVSVLRDDSSTVSDSTWKTLSYKLTSTLQYLDNQRYKLQPVFNLDDTTELEIAKAERGEKLLENLRDTIVCLNGSVLDHNRTSTLLDQQTALRALSEVGEMLVESYPFNVPDQGKFSFLPRLLGRAKVTFTLTRPSIDPKNTIDKFPQIPRFDQSSTTTSIPLKERILGNVTILVDGFIAPITAGNFVDLSIRGFYTDLPVKWMRKRLGVNPSLTMPGADSSNLVVYDIADTLDKIKGMDDSATATDKDSLVVSNMPILGSFGEGFYDPLTAKPRRIPFEVVQYDRNSGKTKLSYSSAAMDSPNQMFTQIIGDKGRWRGIPSIFKEGESLLSSNGSENSIVLNLNIPGLVSMNHPDRNLNGGSSEFFVLQEKDRISERTKLLNGSYAPFGYVIEGLDILQSLEPGDVIRSTHVDEWGKLNLIKIRTLSLTEGITKSNNES